MGAFIEGIFTFPTLFYGGLLCLVVLYWMAAIFGGMDIDGLDIEVDTDSGSSDGSGISGLLSKFKLDGIPLTLILSMVILASWVLCFLGVYFIYPLIPEGWIQVFIGFWLLVIAPVISAAIISPILQPFKPVFKRQPQTRSVDFVGQYAVIRSGKVTDSFGEAALNDSGAGLIIKIRCQEANELKRGEQVILLSYDEATATYQVSAKQ